MRFRWSWHCLWFLLLLGWHWRQLASLGCLQVIDAPALARTMHSQWHPIAMECAIVTWRAMSNAMTDLSCETDGRNLPLGSLQIWFVQRKYLNLRLIKQRGSQLNCHIPWPWRPWARFTRSNFAIVAIHTIPWRVPRFCSTRRTVWWTLSANRYQVVLKWILVEKYPPPEDVLNMNCKLEVKKLPIDLSIMCDLNATHAARRYTFPS